MNKITIILGFLYLLPWGIQCLVNNFMPVYLAELPFATEKIVGYIMAFSSVVTVVSQMVWARIADKSKNKSKVLMWSLIGITCFSMLFTFKNISLPLIFVMIFLFYSCYMVHQTLIDTIAVENEKNLRMSFGGIRSFASLGYALAGFAFGLAGQKSAGAIFYYVAVIALCSAVFAGVMPKSDNAYTNSGKEKSKEFTLNKCFILFLVYTFLLFICTSMMSTFFPVYYSTVLHGDLDFLSVGISIFAILEWVFMLVLGRLISKLSAKWNFLIVALSGVFKSLIIYFVTDTFLVMGAYFFQATMFAFLWSAATPYIARIVPRKNLTVSQGVWTLFSSGIATAVGSFIGGIISDAVGLKNLFLIIAAICGILSLLTFVLFPKKYNKIED